MIIYIFVDYDASTSLEMSIGGDWSKPKVVVSAENADVAVRREAERTRQPHSWSSLVQFPALASVVKRTIYSIYNDKVCRCQMVNSTISQIYISWSALGECNMLSTFIMFIIKVTVIINNPSEYL